QLRGVRRTVLDHRDRTRNAARFAGKYFFNNVHYRSFGRSMPKSSHIFLAKFFLTSRCLGTAVILPVAGFLKIVWLPPSRMKRQLLASRCLIRSLSFMRHEGSDLLFLNPHLPKDVLPLLLDNIQAAVQRLPLGSLGFHPAFLLACLRR